MGQQQLLLIVLSTIIVGISIVVGINMFSSGAVQGNVDAVTQDNITIASRAQEWWRKPAQLGGGGRAWTGIDAAAGGVFTAINFPDSTINGTYAISTDGTSITIVGTGVEDGDGDGTVLTVTTIADSSNIVSTVVAD
jgi:hypothetical protein